MKKLMTMALGLAFALSTVSFAVAQDKTTDTTKTSKKHKKSKTTDSTDKKM